LEKSQKGAICIAVVAKEIVGTGSLIGAEISGVFVSMRMQRKGIGLKIMAHLEALARETGNNSVSLSVSLPSFQFYKALGYMNFKEASIDLGCNQKLNYWRASKSLIRTKTIPLISHDVLEPLLHRRSIMKGLVRQGGTIMYRILFTLLILMGFSSAIAASDEQTNSAYSWLKLIDAGSYEESWGLSASAFQKQLTSAQWSQALSQARKPLGEVQSREVSSATETNALPGAPDGEYIVFTFSSSFENKQSATETLTLIKESDAWRPVGYFIR